jgi:hypothetical protein
MDIVLNEFQDYQLPVDFADKVIKHVSLENKTVKSKDPFWLFLGIIIPWILLFTSLSSIFPGLKSAS